MYDCVLWMIRAVIQRAAGTAGQGSLPPPAVHHPCDRPQADSCPSTPPPPHVCSSPPVTPPPRRTSSPCSSGSLGTWSRCRAGRWPHRAAGCWWAAAGQARPRMRRPRRWGRSGTPRGQACSRFSGWTPMARGGVAWALGSAGVYKGIKKV